MRKILMEIKDLDLSVIIECEEKNKELCDDVWNHLPFDCVQEHGMVSGDLIYCWVPMLSFANVNYKLLHTESPVGCVSYSQGTGNKILIKYGECSEDLYAPVLGYVREDGLKDLARASKDVWFNYFNDKKIYVVNFSKVEE